MIVDRLTIDIDHYEANARLKALRAYYGVQRLDRVDEVVVHVSTGGQGIHIEARFDEVLDADDRHTIRRTLCDDAKRTRLDEQRGAYGHAEEICWSQKADNDGERERMDDIWCALDRIESTRASGYSRAKALAQHGRKAVWDTHGINRPSLAEDA